MAPMTGESVVHVTLDETVETVPSVYSTCSAYGCLAATPLLLVIVAESGVIEIALTLMFPIRFPPSPASPPDSPESAPDAPPSSPGGVAPWLPPPPHAAVVPAATRATTPKSWIPRDHALVMKTSLSQPRTPESTSHARIGDGARV